jgi:predicted  nucleic acid-binding Zn-ribbon protein
MLTPSELQKAKDTLAKVIDTFRAAAALQQVLDTVGQAAIDYANANEQVSQVQAELEAKQAELESTKLALAEARLEKSKIDNGVAALKAELSELLKK